jgi:hypothetical protein
LGGILPVRPGIASGWVGVALPLMILRRAASDSIEVAG